MISTKELSKKYIQIFSGQSVNNYGNFNVFSVEFCDSAQMREKSSFITICCMHKQHRLCTVNFQMATTTTMDPSERVVSVYIYSLLLYKSHKYCPLNRDDLWPCVAADPDLKRRDPDPKLR